MVKLTRSIAFRLFVLIASVQTLILVALTLATVSIQQSHLMENVLLSAGRVSDVIVRSTRYSMMLNRKEDVHNIISSVGEEPGIEGLRIYNKQGEIIFGTNAADLHTRVDMAAEACVSCHLTEQLERPQPQRADLSRVITEKGGRRVLGLITPIRNEPRCSDAPCHAHPTSKTILGVLDVKMSLAQVDQRLDESRKQLFSLSLFAVLLVGLVSGGFIWMVVRKPVQRLVDGMERVSSGNLDHRLRAESRDEIGGLARSFNQMAGELKKAREEITAWSGSLEKKVEEKTADLEKAHQRMLSIEKMASLGGLASTVAHELNNPLEGILTFSKLLIKRIKKTSLPPEDIQAYVDELQLVADEAQRSGNIVKNLLLFSRQKGGVFQRVRLQPVVDRCRLLMNHHAEMHGVKLKVECGEWIELECDSNQIQQAIIALMVNAIEAMSTGEEQRGGGTLTLALRTSATEVQLEITDTGIGMTEETKQKIFEPFFTTKPEGKGVGLGLSIVYGIVERHHGQIEVASAPGEGTTFTIFLPVRQQAPGEHPSENTLEGSYS